MSHCYHAGCETGAVVYYETVLTRPGETDYADGYACEWHEPRWQDFQSEGSEVLQFRIKDLDTLEVVDEYNPCNIEWNDE